MLQIKNGKKNMGDYIVLSIIKDSKETGLW